MDLRSGVSRRLLKGFGSNLYGQAVVALIQLVSVPVLLAAWGTQLYGEWLILFAIPSYLSLTNLGFSMSAANEMTAQVGRRDRQGALGTFHSLTVLLLIASGVAAVLVVACVFLVPMARLHLSVLTVRGARLILLLLAAEMLVKLYDGLNHAGFRSTGDYPLHVALYYSTMLVQYGCLWGVALAGLGPVVAAGGFLAVRAIASVAVLGLLVRRHPWLRPGLRYARVSLLRGLVRPSLANVAIPFAQALNVQGFVLVVGAAIGPAAVVVFSTTRTLTRLVVRMVTSVSESAEPEFALAWGTRDYSLLRRLYVQTLRVGFWLGVLAAALLFFLGGAIFRFWTHGRVSMDHELFHVLIAVALASTLWNGAVTLLKAANRHLRAALVYVAGSGLAVGLGALLLHTSDRLSDAALALLVIDLGMAVYGLYAAGHLSGSGLLPTLGQVLIPRPDRGWRRRSGYADRQR